MTDDRTEEAAGAQIGFDRAKYGVSRADFDALGERAVRDQLNSGKYGHEGIPEFDFVSAWLADAEFARLATDSAKRDAREEETLSIARSALFNSKRANTIAIIAITLSAATAIIVAVVQFIGPKP